MSEEKDYGGSAFPVLDGTESGLIFREFGMTLRDYFAIAAMAAWIMNPDSSQPRDENLDSHTKQAYLVADAMLKARRQ